MADAASVVRGRLRHPRLDHAGALLRAHPEDAIEQPVLEEDDQLPVALLFVATLAADPGSLRGQQPDIPLLVALQFGVAGLLHAFLLIGNVLGCQLEQFVQPLFALLG